MRAEKMSGWSWRLTEQRQQVPRGGAVPSGATVMCLTSLGKQLAYWVLPWLQLPIHEAHGHRSKVGTELKTLKGKHNSLASKWFGFFPQCLLPTLKLNPNPNVEMQFLFFPPHGVFALIEISTIFFGRSIWIKFAIKKDCGNKVISIFLQYGKSPPMPS